MSTYMKALRRLESDGQLAAPAPATAPVVRRATRDAEEATRRRLPTSPASAAPEIEALLDQLRTLAAQGDGARVLVFAPVSIPGAARGVLEALATRGRELRLPIAVAELARTAGTPQLVVRGGEAPARPLELDGPGLSATMREWRGDLAPAPLVLIDAPPLQRSVDAVLLAAACDGLVLVAETGLTERAALRAAAERARDGGCRTLGVVLTRREA
ncbi:MAG TPA: hypothetical protein VL049_28860 [Candidatus Dormibacteraeota bacterium]|nr:hypothetical protein [Candidatus Dormibacteraeota bacterium]